VIAGHPSCRIVYGPPGTGKTHYLLEHVSELLAAGVLPQQIAFLAFTTKASKEAKSRALAKFNFKERDFQWFRTIHSFAFQHLGLRREGVLDRAALQELSKVAGVEIQGKVWTEDGAVTGASEGDTLLFLDGLARMRRVPLKQVFEEDDHGLNWGLLEQFSRSYAAFRRSRALFDYTDMLESCLECQVPPPALHTLIVDEAQDLSSLQWTVVQQIAANAQHVILAGDPDQAIFRFSGAEAEGMMRAEGASVLLTQSRRIPASVHSLAMELRRRIPKATTNAFSPRPEPGRVEYLAEPEMVDLSAGKWLLLARHVYQLKRYERICEQQGVPYEIRGKRLIDSPSLRAVMTWEDLRRGKAVDREAALEMASFLPSSSSVHQTLGSLKTISISAQDIHNGNVQSIPLWHEALVNLPPGDRAYFLSARRRGEKLLAEPRVKVSTIHGAKGGEAENVLLITDTSKASFQNAQIHPEDEARCYYVGATRAEHNLFVVRPQTELFYEI
jgi:superfamily I DNA/RNA helicase